jgi:homoaconitase/3-isopropylmalate dehydratase large subunit
MSVEFVDADKQLPMSYRNTIANMMAEGEATNGIFAPDDLTYAWYRDKGLHRPPYPRFGPGADAIYEIDEVLDLSEVVPLIAKPFSPGNAFPRTRSRREHIAFDKAFIGSCTNGGYGDLLEAALVLRAAATKARSAPRTSSSSSRVGRVKKDIERTDARPRWRVDRRRVPLGRRCRSANRGAAHASARVPTRS